MISWLAAALLVAVSLILFKVFGVIDNSLQVIRLSSQSAAVVTDKSLSDRHKEKELQRITLLLFKLFLLILVGSVFAVGLPVAAIWAFHYVGPGSWDETLATTLSWPFILVSSVFGIGVYIILTKKGEKDPADV